MGKSNTELLKIAQSHLGQNGTRFRKFCGLPAGAAWCNAFVDYVANEGGDSSLYFNGAKMTYCPTSMKWCQKNLASVPVYLSLPMDIIYFDWEPNGVPNHIGFVRERKSATEIYTIEGNTSGGIVAQKTRTAKYVSGVFRPHFKAKFNANKKLEVDGLFGYNSIAVMQRWLGVTIDAILGIGTVKALQKLLGVTQDGSWETKTSKALQKLIGTTDDGYFGPESVKALQRYLNAKVFVPKSNGDKIADKAFELAYPGEPEIAKYPSGKPKESYKKALDKAYPKRSNWSDAPREGASCDVFVGTVIRTSGVDVNIPRGLSDQQPYLAKSSKFECIITATSKNVPKSILKDGDIVTYHNEDGGGHIMIYSGGKARHAANDKWYPRTTSIDSRLKISSRKWIKVYRAK